MIPKADTVAKIRPGRPFDRVAAALIGTIAVLAALLSVVQATEGHIGGRAQLMGARLEADISARSAASELAGDFGGVATLQALRLGLSATSRQLEATRSGDAVALAVGQSDQTASDRLTAAVSDTAATSGGAPLDTYAAGLIKTTVPQLQSELAEQNRQIDVAAAAGSRSRLASLGLSFAALAGVLVGLALVLRESRAGWIALTVACGVAGASLLAGISSAI